MSESDRVKEEKEVEVGAWVLCVYVYRLSFDFGRHAYTEMNLRTHTQFLSLDIFHIFTVYRDRNKYYMNTHTRAGE